jgi:AmmeMemoRadiSam system protein A
MIGIYNDKQGKEFLEFAREVLEKSFNGQKVSVPDKLHFRQARGVYIFLKDNGKLRGSYSFKKASFALGDAIARGVYNAAFEDKKFPPLSQKELSDLKIELHIVNDPVEIKDSIGKELDFGKDGLICRYLSYEGILLPNVIKEKGLSKIEFIEEVCKQAGMPKDYWQNNNLKFYRFRVQSFKE